MKRAELQTKVDQELDHIPRWIRGSKQNELRLTYNIQRRHYLAKYPEKTAYDCLMDCIAIVKQSDPSFIAQYDSEFFKQV